MVLVRTVDSPTLSSWPAPWLLPGGHAVPHTRFLPRPGLLHLALDSSAARPSGAILHSRIASKSTTGSKTWNQIVHKEAPCLQNGEGREGARARERRRRCAYGFGGYRYILASQQVHRNGIHDRTGGPALCGRAQNRPHAASRRRARVPLPARVPPPHRPSSPVRPATLPPHTAPSLLGGLQNRRQLCRTWTLTFSATSVHL